MDDDLERRWERVVCRRDRMLAQLAQWPAESLRVCPANGGWSALEVVDHLVRSHREVLRRMQDVRQPHPKVKFPDRLRGWMVWGVMWLPTRVAMPKSVEPQVRPASTDDLATLAEEWKRVDAALHDHVVALSDAERRAGVARHPVSGWLDARAGIRFIESHLAHHGYQISRLSKIVKTNS